MVIPIPDNEQQRLEALTRYRILDTPAEACFDRLTALACNVFRTSLAQLNFVDGSRAWAKSSCGFSPSYIPREHSFCTFSILSDEVMVIPDPREDSRFFDNPFVNGPPYVRFYAGAPLKTADGFRLGTVCVYDSTPRHNLDSHCLSALETLAAIAMDELEQRRSVRTWYTEAFESSVCGLGITDETGKLVEANEAFCRLTGYEWSELIGRPFTMLVPPPARDRVARVRKAVALGGVYPAVESVLETRSGRHVPILAVDARIARPEGNYCLTSFFEVTDLRRAEEEIQRIQKLEAVRRLAGGVAHNINNLLTVIIGYSQIMADGLDPEDLRKRYALEIANAADRAALITGQLLSFSRHGVLAPRILEVNEIVSVAEQRLRAILGAGIEFRTVLRPEAGRIRAGAGQIEQVLTNLALNAKEAMPEGGSFTIETNRVELDEDYQRLHPGVKPGEYSLITITDTGHGMDEETRSHLFEPYFTTKGIGKGTGLAVVYGIVRQCGGDLAIYTEPGGGTTVGLFIPKVAETEGPPVEPHKLLLVENDRDTMDALREALASDACAISLASTAEEALRVWEQDSHEVRAVIVDLALPAIGGAELAEMLRAGRPDLRVLYLARPGEPLPAGARDSTHDLFLETPFTADQLRAKAQALLSSDSVPSPC